MLRPAKLLLTGGEAEAGDLRLSYFLLGEESALDREEIDDVATALGALQFTSIPVETHVAILGERAQGFQQQEGWLIYRRYEPSESSS